MASEDVATDMIGTPGDKDIGASDIQDDKNKDDRMDKENVEGEHEVLEHMEKEPTDTTVTENVDSEHMVKDAEQAETTVADHVEGEKIEGDSASEHIKTEYTEGEQMEDEQTEVDDEEKLMGEGEEPEPGEQEEKSGAAATEEVVEEEQAYVEEPPPDPAAPYNFSDSQELLKEPFQLRPDQLAEVEQLWELYQNYNPAYTDLDGYITEKELVYMLKCLLLMTYTPEQLQELITFCVRPPHPQGHITFKQFLRMVSVRQRDFPIEEELRTALQILDPEKTGSVDREYLRDVLSRMGHKMPPKILEHLIKEVDLSNDGTIGIEDVVGTMSVDLNRDDIIMLRQTLFPKEGAPTIEVDEDDNGDNENV